MNPEEARDRAGPDRDDAEERRRLLRRLVNFTPRELRELWKLGAFAELAPGPRALFVALVARMSVETLEAFPSQARLADEIGWSMRSVVRWTAELVELGIINEPRVLRERGVLHYELGPSSYAAVHEYLAQHPAPSGIRPAELDALERIEMLERENAELRARENAAVAALGGAAASRIRCITPTWRIGSDDTTQSAALASEVVNSLKTDEASSSSDRAGAREEEEISISSEDKSAARSALGELAVRARPRRPRPRFFDAELVQLVALCAATVAGDEGAKLAALRQAIEGAWVVSSGPPSVRYVFGELEKFEAHVARAASRARALERRPTSPPREAVARPLEGGELAELEDVTKMLASAGMLAAGVGT